MKANIAKPIIRIIKDNEKSLEEFETITLPAESEKIQDLITNFPTVYIHNWPETDKYEVYVGESNNIFKRTREHYHSRIDNENWQHKLIGKEAMLYIIGHEHFNKSLTMDIENRLMHYLMSVDKVRQVHNARTNPQNRYYPYEEFDAIFRKIWRELHDENAFARKERQIIFIDGEAGTGKTVLNGSIFYELYCKEEKKGKKDFKCNIVVNHEEQVHLCMR